MPNNNEILDYFEPKQPKSKSKLILYLQGKVEHYGIWATVRLLLIITLHISLTILLAVDESLSIWIALIKGAGLFILGLVLMSSKWFKSSVFRRKRLKSLQMVILAR
ncbi:MAG: hypothetical protein GY810_26240 [Aureispira sp.]|nr:hypothetical protein [Aureispira sp.]